MRPLYFRCTDASRNADKWYAVHVGCNLFGDLEVVCRWGRMGGNGHQERSVTCASRRQAGSIVRDIVALRRAHGYTES